MSKKTRHYKLVTTTSGAHYVAADDGRVVRIATEIAMVNTLDNFQYTRGFLQEGFAWDDIKEGSPLPWMGVRFDKFTEPLTSTSIVAVVTTDSTTDIAEFAVDAYLEDLEEFS